jgi:AAA ATPase domain
MTSSKAAPEAAVFVGRAAELSILKDAAETANSGRFSAVLISGEPGIGKTRLADEACIYAQEMGFSAMVGRCFDSHGTVSYFPFIQVLSVFAKHPAPRSRTTAGRLGAKPRDAAEIVARLTKRAQLPSRSNPEALSAAQTKLFESVASFLKDRSEICPLLLVLEDLDWADDSSLSLLLYLVRMVNAARLMIIATCRANEARQRFELVRTLAECERYRSYQRIRLKGLPESEAASLAEQLFGLESGTETRRITAEIGRLANGNPLFMHHVVRHLAEAGLGKHTAQPVLSAGWESRLAADNAITELVDARLSQLSKPCRDALSHAAVLGADFEFEVLAQVLSCAAGELADLMKEACDAAVLTEATRESSDYVFVHRLIRQSLYERQSRPARRTAHANAARAIEAVHASDLDRHLSQLALHYGRAGRAGNLAKATEYSIRAGEKASNAAAYADAACHWRTALQLVSARDRTQRAYLTERLGEASLGSATPAEAARHLQTALKLYAELGQEADAARVHARLVTAISLLSMSPAAIDVGKAVSHSRRAEKLLAIRADPAAEGELLMGEALAAHAQFRTEEGLIASKRAMEIAQLLDNTVIWCQAAAFHGHLLFASGKLKEGIGLMEQAAEQAEHTHDLKPRFAAASFLSFSYLLLWDPGSAERTIQAALADTDAGQVEFLRQILVAYLGIANVYAGAFARAQSFLTIAPHHFLEANLRIAEGEWGQAEELLNQQIERSHVTQSKQQHWTGSLWLARLKRVQGDDAGALELLTKTPLIAESLLRIPEEISTRSELALVRLACGQVSEARSEVRRCRALLQPGEDWRALSAFVDRAEAAVMAYDGLIDEASQLWRSAGEVFSRYRLPWEVAETFLVWASLLARHGRAEESAAKLQGAAQIYRHLQLGPCWNDRIAGLSSSARLPSAPPLDGGSIPPQMLIQTGATPSNGIHALVTTHDVALLATLIHDAIAHLMNAIDKAAKLRVPIERIAAATEEISRISTPVERLVRALAQGGRDSAPVAPPRPARGAQSGRALGRKLNRGHDPGRPL